MPDSNSATLAELLEAEALRLRLFVNGQSPGEMDKMQRDLIDGARNLYTTSPRSDPEDLGRRVELRLRDLPSEELAPWVRVGRTIFRAQEFTSDGQTVSVAANIVSPAIHAELMRLRENRSAVPFASPHDVRPIQSTQLSTRTVTNVHDEETHTLTAGENIARPMHMSVNGISADKVLRRSLSDGR